MMLPEDLKNYRAPREPWRLILGAAVIFAALTFIGPADFAAELEVEAEAKILRAERAKVALQQIPNTKEVLR